MDSSIRDRVIEMGSRILFFGDVVFGRYMSDRHFVSALRGIKAIYLNEELADLLARGKAEGDCHVYPTGADQGFVQLVREIGGHDQNATFVRSNAVDGIEQTGERYSLF